MKSNWVTLLFTMIQLIHLTIALMVLPNIVTSNIFNGTSSDLSQVCLISAFMCFYWGLRDYFIGKYKRNVPAVSYRSSALGVFGFVALHVWHLNGSWTGLDTAGLLLAVVLTAIALIKQLKLQKNAIALLLLFSVMMPSGGFSETEIPCDPKNQITFNKTLDRYFPVYIEWNALMMKINAEIALQLNEYSKKVDDDPSQIFQEMQRIGAKRNDKQKFSDLFSQSGVTQEEFFQFSGNCLNKQADAVQAYLRVYPALKEKLKETAPKSLFAQEEIRPEEVTIDSIKKFLPAIIEQSEHVHWLRGQMDKLSQEDSDAQKLMVTDLIKESHKKQNDLLKKYSVTPEELSRWRQAMITHPLTYKYVEKDKPLKIRFTQMVQSEQCAKDRSQPGCEKTIISKKAMSPKDMQPKDVSPDIVKKIVPAFIEDGENSLRYHQRLQDVEKLYQTDPNQVERMRKELEEERRTRKEAILKKYDITSQELYSWLNPVMQSPVAKQYFDEHPDLQQRLQKITRPVPSCNEQPFQSGCGEFLNRCREDLDQSGCEKVRNKK